MQTTKLLIRFPQLKFLIITGLIFLGSFGLFTSIKQFLSSSQCINPTTVDDFTVNKNESVHVCGDKIVRGRTEVANKGEYPDLFEYKNTKGEIEPIQQYVKVFIKDNSEYVSVTSVIDYSSWFKSAIGIYQKDGNSYKQVFKKSYFNEDFGRWNRIDLVNNQSTISISGDLGYLGCLGCRIDWTDYYDWDSNQKTYVLANNKHKDKFQELLIAYEKTDKEACSSEIPTKPKRIISEIYQIRKDHERFCDDQSESPLITSQQAEIFLKTKQAIERVMDGENLSNQDVSKITI